jgi:hypothetical protein
VDVLHLELLTWDLYGAGLTYAGTPCACFRDHGIDCRCAQESRQNSSGGKDCLGRVSKSGNGYLRYLIVVGATP